MFDKPIIKHAIMTTVKLQRPKINEQESFKASVIVSITQKGIKITRKFKDGKIVVTQILENQWDSVIDQFIKWEKKRKEKKNDTKND